MENTKSTTIELVSVEEQIGRFRNKEGGTGGC